MIFLIIFELFKTLKLKNKLKNTYKIIFNILLWGFAIAGFGLSVGYIAIRLQLTNEKGVVDFNNRKFEAVSLKNGLNRDSSGKALFKANEIAQIAYKLMILEKFFPANAKTIINELEKTRDFELANKMIQAVIIKTSDSIKLENEFEKDLTLFSTSFNYNDNNAFDWINQNEWQALREAIKKDKPAIDSAAKTLGIESRFITTLLIGEQLRLLNSNRESFKSALRPLRVLTVESQYSFGVTGIKDFTAIQVEKSLKDTLSPYYLGKRFENVIQYKTTDISSERMSNLINYNNHYYSYLYAGLIIRQIREQWKRAGYDISERPEILATLFNIGFHNSKPKQSPETGGSNIKIGNKNYTFGGIAFEFYYSGELSEEFPYETIKWKD